MRRFWISPQSLQGSQVFLQGDVFHHIFHVCHIEKGERIEVLYGEPHSFVVEIVKIGKKEAEARVIEKKTLATLEKPWINLALSLPKISTFEFVLEKSVELGVHSIHPFISERSFFKTKSKITDSRKSRWEKQIRLASQQSARGELFHLHDLKTFDELVLEYEKDQGLGLLFYEKLNQENLNSIKEINFSNYKTVWIFIGSEGGFSEKEFESFTQKGIKALSLGPQILKVETACISAVSIIKYLVKGR